MSITHRAFAKKEEKHRKEDKKQKEKEDVHQQFEGKDIDALKKEFNGEYDVRYWKFK